MSAMSRRRGIDGPHADVLPLLAQFAAWFERWVDALNAYDVEALMQLVTADIHWEDPAMFGRVVTNYSEFRRFVEASLRAFPDIRFAPTGAPYLAADGSSFAVPWRITGTFTGALERWGERGTRSAAFGPTGRRVTSEGIDLYELRDGLLCRWVVYYDLFDVSVQAGLAPSPESRLVRAAALGQRALAASRGFGSRRRRERLRPRRTAAR